MANNPVCIGSVLRATRTIIQTKNHKKRIESKTPSEVAKDKNIISNHGFTLPSKNCGLSKCISAVEYEKRYGKKVNLFIFKKIL